MEDDLEETLWWGKQVMKALDSSLWLQVRAQEWLEGLEKWLSSLEKNGCSSEVSPLQPH